MPEIFGYALYGKGRPSRKAQKDALAAFGVDVGEIGTLWEDEHEPKRGRPSGKLPERSYLLGNLEEGDTVVVAAPYCLGIGRADAQWFIDELAARGAVLHVLGNAFRVEPGGDTSELLAALEARQNTTHQQAARARAKERPKRRKRKAKTEPKSK